MTLSFAIFEVDHLDFLLVVACGVQRALVDEVGDVGAAEAGCAAGDDREVDVFRQRDVARMHAQDSFAALEVGKIDDDAAVEAAGTKQRGIENVGTVRAGDEDHAFVRFEAVHFDEELIERLLALIVTAAQAGAAMAADGVDLVDEDDAGRVLLSLLEEVAHARGADADEHLDEVGAGDREEGDVRFAGDGAGEERLAGARRSDEENAFRDLAAEFRELLRLLEELDDLVQLDLGFVDAGDVFERHLLRAAGEELGLRFAERERLVSAGLHLAHEEDPEADEEEEGCPGDEGGHERSVALRLELEDDAFLVERLVGRFGHGGRAGGVKLVLAARRGGFHFAANLGTANGYFFNLPLLDSVHERAEHNLFAGPLGRVEQAPEEEHQHDDDDPQERRFDCRIQRIASYVATAMLRTRHVHYRGWVTSGEGGLLQPGPVPDSANEGQICKPSPMFQSVTGVGAFVDGEDAEIGGHVDGADVGPVEECDEAQGGRGVGAELGEEVILDDAGVDDVLEHVDVAVADVGEAEEVDLERVGDLVVPGVAHDVDESVTDVPRQGTKEIGEEKRRSLQDAEQKDLGVAGVFADLHRDLSNATCDFVSAEDRGDPDGLRIEN